MAAVASPEMEAYFEALEAGADACYELVGRARKAGYDLEDEAEIPRARDLAERVEAQVGPVGIAPRIREVIAKHDRQTAALLVARELAGKLRDELGVEKALEQAVRTSLSILTEGVLVAPTEGVVRVTTMENHNSTRCAAIYYAGPIRAAGGTAQALSVLIADVVRRELGLDAYIPTPAEVERYKEEIPLYKRAVNLQYLPSSDEIDAIVRACPVCITGEPTERLEVAGNRDLPRVETNRLRGGAALVIAEGLCLKAAKILKHVERLEIGGWDFLRAYAERKQEQAGAGEYKYLKDVLVGRPIFAFPDRPGGFRLRYGRTRLTGLAAVALNPATMIALDSFTAIGTQLKIQLPGKAAAVTPCDSIEGPLVLLDDGSCVRPASREEAEAVAPRIREIIDVGEVLIPPGEFLENNHALVPGGWCSEWWEAELRAAGGEPLGREPDFATALALSQQHNVPLHPAHTFLWHDLSLDELAQLRQLAAVGSRDGDGFLFPVEAQPLLLTLGVPFAPAGDSLHVGTEADALLHCLGDADAEGDDVLAQVSATAGVEIMPKAPTRLGASMGRPEKADVRRMKPPPHVLFPVGLAGGPQRMLNKALESQPSQSQLGRPGKGVELEAELRYCRKCSTETIAVHHCGQRTVAKEQAKRREVDLRAEVAAAQRNAGIGVLPPVKGVRSMMSASRTPEALEKGLLRARYDLRVFKDGTLRYDMMNLPLTHFRPAEIGLAVEKARELGYTHDIDGKALEAPDQLIELRVQDLIISRRASDWLLGVARFVDDELVQLYGCNRFYKLPDAAQPEDLIGQLFVCLSPHTSAGVLARLIGFTHAKVQYAHPYMHAAKRRNCDGDEDSVILLLDCLLNFSEHFLPTTRGGTRDIPRGLSTRIDPTEIDNEAHN
ncbi:MAG: DNA polymerase II large subunit, partial [Candidatus Poseidoniia archaeon]|nr:DNA polymerase II large subunit [Candidatus Poseidoniia archaeon]